MNRELESYYESELQRIYQEAEEFARRKGKIAARLKLGRRGSQDPHVERLLQGFAFVAAGIRQRLDEDFPLLAETLLSSLYPHLLRPRPSMAIVHLTGAAAVAGVPGGYVVPENSSIVTSAIDGSLRKYRTRYPVNLLPIEVSAAELLPVPPGLDVPDDAVSMLKLKFSITAPGQTFASLAVSDLRIYLNSPKHSLSQIYSFFFAPVKAVAIFQSEEGQKEVEVRLVPCGFNPGEGMLPYAAPTPEGYQLLADYFAFHEKFCFFEMENLPSGIDVREMEVRIYGGNISSDAMVRKEHFLLGCVPAINLFDADLHLSLTHEQPEYRLAMPDEFGEGCHVYSVEEVTAIPPQGKQFDIDPFYPFRHVEEDNSPAMFHLSRRRDEDVFLSFIDMREGVSRWDTAQLSVSALCFHGPSGAPLPPHPEFTLPERKNAVERVDLVGEPTRPLFPTPGREAQWRLMSHLVLNHLSLSGGESGAAALREILRLYDWDGGVVNRTKIGGIRSIDSRQRIFKPNSDNPDLLGCFLGGLDVEILLRDEIADDALFAAILESFLSGHAALNTPLRMAVRSELPGGRSWQFPIRMGTRRML